MTNPTSNFGWQMPTATDLVTDLPADFAVFGQAVDTTMADLKGGTTGQILSKATSTDMDFVWTDAAPGDITGVTVSSPITGGGTSGTVNIAIQDASTTQKGSVQLSDSTSTTSSILAATPTAVKSAYDLANGAIPKTLTTTTGDTIYAASANTPARLAVGTTGQVLTVAGGVPTWATPSSGGMTVIASGNLTVGASTITISSIPNTYKDLRLVVRNYKPSNDGDSAFCRINSDSTASRHQNISVGSGGPSTFTGTYWTLDNGNDDTVSQYLTCVDYNDYANTTTWKTAQIWSIATNAATPTSFVYWNRFAMYNQIDAISSLVIGNVSGSTTFNGGTYILYGVK